MSLIVRDARSAFNYLNGVFCIYKAVKTPYKTLINNIKHHLKSDLNQLETRPAKQIVNIIGNVGVDKDFSIEKSLSFADHQLVVGERYSEKDVALRVYQNLGLYVSGVTLVGVGQEGCNQLAKIRRQNLIKEYEIKCRLGMATLNFTEKGKIIKESSYKYVTSFKINAILNKILSANTRYALKSLGARLNTQEAYDILSKGQLRILMNFIYSFFLQSRPEIGKSDPVLYHLKCIELKEPYFKLKVTCVNENHLYFYHLVNQIGLSLKTHACVSSMICTRLGKFTIDDSLSYKEFNAESIINNITMNFNKVQELLQNIEFNKNIKANNLNTIKQNTEFKKHNSPLLD